MNMKDVIAKLTEVAAEFGWGLTLIESGLDDGDLAGIVLGSREFLEDEFGPDVEIWHKSIPEDEKQ